MPLLVSRTDALREELSRCFNESLIDGCWYPAAACDEHPALVRVHLAGASYCIERRRAPDSAWLPVVTADAAEFDRANFRIWREQYPLVA